MRPFKWAGFIIILEFLTTFVAFPVAPLFLAMAAATIKGCLLIIPERANIDYLNPKFALDSQMSVVRYGRRSKYYLNLSGTTLHTWGNNVTVNAIFYEYLHNEYRRSFVEMHFKFCDMLKVPLVGQTLQAVGWICPLPPGYHAYINMTASTDNFNMVFPFEKTRADIEFLTSDGELIGNGHIYAQFLDKKSKNSKVGEK